MEVYIVLDEYEQRDGYFGYDLAFTDYDEAKKAASILKELNEDSYHDVFTIDTDGTLEEYLCGYYDKKDYKHLL